MGFEAVENPKNRVGRARCPTFWDLSETSRMSGDSAGDAAVGLDLSRDGRP